MATVLLVLFLVTNLAHARDPKQVAAFRTAHACPSTGKFTGACPGFVVDHVWSLCLGGPDVQANMRWQTSIEAQLKDVFERDMCAMKRTLEEKSAETPGRSLECPSFLSACHE